MKLKELLREHFEAEAQRDIEWIKRTVSTDCEYEVIGPTTPTTP